jgi:poly-gamma-glutamate synthesis protein (capsule biosynthesis protein)
MTEITLTDYEREVPHAAIDAGADLIVGNHTHVLRGVEFYQGKPIFHCLGNLVTVFRWSDHHMFKQPDPESTLTKSRLRGGKGSSRSWIDLEYPCYPFPPVARKSIIAKCVIAGDKISRISYLPVLINKKGQPEILKNDTRGQEVFDYMDKITQGAGLNARYDWDGDEVVVHA